MSALSKHLRWLEAEAVSIVRETYAQFDRPVLLFSGGKDSICILELARRAFLPGRVPFPILHIDTGHNFPETIAFRDQFAETMGVSLLVRSVEDSIRLGRVSEEVGETPSRNALQTVTLLDALRELGFDAAIGGARRDEEKARSKERVFSHRDRFGQWDPRRQRPEVWSLYNGRKGPGEHFRVFPLSNWTELDVWQYIRGTGLPVPGLYLAHTREVVERDGVLLARSAFIQLRPGERYEARRVRYRTIGDMTCTGAVDSSAATIDDVIAEVAIARSTERATRADDRRSDAAMEDRKRAGYF